MRFTCGDAVHGWGVLSPNLWGEVTCSKKWNEQSTNKHTHKHTHKKVTQNIHTEGKIRGNKKVNRSSFSIRETALCPGLLMLSAHCKHAPTHERT